MSPPDGLTAKPNGGLPPSPDSRETIVETLLSRRPRASSLPVAVLSGMLMLLVSLLHWRSAPGSAGLGATLEEVVGYRQYWRLFTSMAAHHDLGHFASNAVPFLLLSYLLFGYFGFWIYPAMTLLIGSLTTYLSLMTYPPETVLLGASGLVYLMAGFWLSLYAVVERTLPLRRRLLRLCGVGLVVLVPSSFQEDVSYRTHAIGFALGVVWACAYFILRRKAIRSAEIVVTEVED